MYRARSGSTGTACRRPPHSAKPKREDPVTSTFVLSVLTQPVLARTDRSGHDRGRARLASKAEGARVWVQLQIRQKCLFIQLKRARKDKKKQESG